MTITASANVTELLALNERLVRLAEEESVPQAVGTARRLILEKTGAGKDAFDETFAPYTEAYARRLNIPRQPKTLKREEGRLYALSVCPDRSDDFLLTVPADSVKIARGQMSGGGGRWKYQHKFLTLSKQSIGVIGHELITFLRGRING